MIEKRTTYTLTSYNVIKVNHINLVMVKRNQVSVMIQIAEENPLMNDHNYKWQMNVVQNERKVWIEKKSRQNYEEATKEREAWRKSSERFVFSHGVT